MKRVQKKCGFSMVEIMVAVLVLLTLALGGAAVMYHSGGGIQREQNKRDAVVAANRILEEYWNSTYADLGSLAGPSFSRPVTVNGNATQALITISDEQTDSDGGKYYDIAVVVTPQNMSEETVSMQTRRYRRGLSKAALN